MAPPRPATSSHAEPAHALDPDLHHEPAAKLLAIDWNTVALTTEAEALALWAQIAPTPADFEAKLDELPASVVRPLAIALVRGGRFTCMPAPVAHDCALPTFDVTPPAPTAGFTDPCFRRVLALWALSQLDEGDFGAVSPAFRAIAAIPPPESELVAAMLKSVPEHELDAKLELLALAWQAGQHDVVEESLGSLDESHLIAAVKLHHIAGALPVLSAEAHRPVYLAAVTDEALDAAARAQAITELVAADDALAADGHAALAADTRAALVTATKSPDCALAAAAAHMLDQRGDHRFVPNRDHARTEPQVMRAICVLASYQSLQQSDEPPLVARFVPSRGLERVLVTYDPNSEVDTDGDGDPHTNRTIDLIPRADAVLTDNLADLARAMRSCQRTTCTSDDRIYRFGFKLDAGTEALVKIEVIDRPPCHDGTR